ncbi:MAG: GHMP kinase [Chloroflexi bacterium RBG_13_68_17]|nr:MAG: GHMP kinase [Chloroflexi bacterium RBG_13_68_17]
MIVVQTPLRVSLFGGGTDFPTYFRAEGGCVLTTAIDKYVFVTIKKRFDDMLRVGYTRTELVEDVADIQHELIREALQATGIRRGVEITTMADIPSAGSGLGSSGAVTVGALHAMHTYRGEMVSADQLAREACEIEIEVLSKPIGVQDQYIAAHGGFRWMEFTRDGEIQLERMELPASLEQQLNENLLLFFTGVTRDAGSILAEQEANITDRAAVLREMKDLAREARAEMDRGNIDSLGRLLDVSWDLKRKLASKITNGKIDAIYQAARQAGALGGKITGAGGGGFLLVYCPDGKRQEVRQALKDLRELPFRFEPDGTKVIFNYRR